eukprot:3069048-Rhodomonas_salina.1
MTRLPSLFQLYLLFAIAGDLHANFGHSYVMQSTHSSPPSWLDNPLQLRGSERREEGMRGGGAVNLYWTSQSRGGSFVADSSEE